MNVNEISCRFESHLIFQEIVSGYQQDNTFAVSSSRMRRFGAAAYTVGMSSNDDNETTSDTPSESLIATAYHEAGHAVMAVSLGRTIHKATIASAKLQTGGVRLGAVKMEQGRSGATRDWLENEVLILFAGMVAESQFTGSYCPRGAASDLRAIERLLSTRANTERQFEKLHRRLLDKTEYLLGDEVHEKAITSVAEQLLEHETIKGRLVKHFLNQAISQSNK